MNDLNLTAAPTNPAAHAPGTGPEPFTRSVTIELVEPITVNGIEMTAITMRRPAVRDNIAAVKQGRAGNLLPAEEDLHLFASLTGLTPHDLLQLDMADFQQMQEEYANFLRRPSKTSGGQ
ncbi:phage tail assembly protein [Burkholderia arboris]|uniref:Phage tail assembly protein n=1 Tax=Burkholderia metallica TaxID=488729 RepID=A0ABT8PLC3_9BURK|nr:MULTISPECIES: phage tail assembly protein [Burkholderia cepacia complex]MCA8032023.1 phage tail assembly protein [Burkholderia arboris]MDN7935193.1 phage tail assembly protein [Burkholderia metallica]